MISILKVQKDSFSKCHTEVQIQFKVYAHQIQDMLIKALSWVKVQNVQNPELSNLKLALCPLNIHNFKFKWSNVLRQTENKPEKL